MKKIVLSAFLLFSQFGFSAPTGEDARALVENQARVILNNLNANQAQYQSNPKAFSQMIAQEIIPYMDFESMAQVVLGQNWKKLDTSKKQEFIGAFKEFLIRAYSKGWSDFTGASPDEVLKVLNTPNVDKNKRTKLKLQIKNKRGKVSNVEFSLHHKSEWKIYDVAFENVSFLLSYRNSFAKIVKEQGIDALIAQLQDGSLKE